MLSLHIGMDIINNYKEPPHFHYNLEHWKFLLIDETQKVFFLYTFWDWMSPKTLDSNVDVSDRFREGRNLFQCHMFPKLSTCLQLVLSTLPLPSAILCLLALLISLQSLHCSIGSFLFTTLFSQLPSWKNLVTVILN